jgi:hypothetical protein
MVTQADVTKVFATLARQLESRTETGSMAERLFAGNREPSINELLTDEIARLLRAADGLDLADVIREVEAAKSNVED